MKTVLRERGGFLGVGAMVVRAGQIDVGDEVIDLGPAAGGAGAHHQR